MSGAAMIADAVPPDARARTPGVIDIAVAIAGAVGGLASGLVVSAADFPVLALAGGLLSLAVIPVISATANSRRPSRQDKAAALDGDLHPTTYGMRMKERSNDVAIDLYPRVG
ncbi:MULTISPECIES: hypothetical protein [unclassified Streptomyces]|uniref:hypothetical protein n=1 Tax=unclassified Streptomyces TaxID=2593676 RepID=UPI0033F4E309